MRKIITLTLLSLCGLLWSAESTPQKKWVWYAKDAVLNQERIELRESAKVSGRPVAGLKKDVVSRVESAEDQADLTFSVRIPAGRYLLRTYAVTDAEGADLMAKAKTKYESLFLKLQIDNELPLRRVVYVPWNRQPQTFGKIDSNGKEQLWKIQLPRGVELDRLELTPYSPPKVPQAARNYQPPVVPAKERPRLWMTPATLPAIRANLTKGENAPVWKTVQEKAQKPFAYTYDPTANIQYNADLEEAARCKAFCYQVTGDRKMGREAVDLMLAYLPNVQFGNMLDITREIGRAIVACSFVYDYCHDLMTPEERQILSRSLMRLADDMECGYPPFLQTIVNGHGNEAQINRDFLSMGIALYGENEEPYRYAAYCILEQLVPMRAFEYRSARHNQGIGYGSYRFNFEMHAAWLMRRMAGREIFDPGIRDVYYYWLYARQPDGSMIMDGDRSMRGGYYKNIPVTFMCSTYAANPIFKGEFQRQGGTENINLLDPLIFLMINDPDLKGDPDLSKLPTAHLFRGPLASIIFRTGWNIAPDSNDALVEMKASEYNNANHQHVDAGAFQIYFRGELATDLGMYKFSGTPYDFGFNKRSVAHNVMLIHDPAETFERGNPSNDGGQRVVSRTATSVKMLTSDPHFHTAETRFMAAGPDLHRPEYAYFRSNLAPAYSDKIRFYERSFCTLKFADPERPVALITIDRVESARADHPKYYQLNTLRAPVQTPEGLTYLARRKNPGKLTVQMLLPENPAVTVLSGKKAWDIFGKELAPPLPKDKQANGTRTLFAPSRAQKDDLFVTVLQAGGETSKPYPVQWKKGDDLVEISIGEWLAVLSTAKKPLNGTFYFTVPEGCKKVVIGGLAAGEWRLDCGKEIRKFSVNSLEGTAYLEVPAGMCRISR